MTDDDIRGASRDQPRSPRPTTVAVRVEASCDLTAIVRIGGGWWISVLDDNPGHRRGVRGLQNRIHACVRQDSTWVWMAEANYWYLPDNWRESMLLFKPEKVGRSTLEDRDFGDALTALFRAVEAAASPEAHFEQKFVDFLADE